MRARSTTFEVYSRGSDVIGEGPLWSKNDQTLYWIDIGRRMLYAQSAAELQRRSWVLPDYPGSLASLGNKALATAMGDGIHRLDLDTGAIDLMYLAPARPPGTRFNDGKVDPLGRFWAGTMQNNFDGNEAPVDVDRSIGALYRFEPGGHVATVEENIGIANTLAWSPDLRRFYFADSLRAEVYVYDFDACSGSVWNKRILFEDTGYGVPDGSAIDVDGCLWNARWDASAIIRITPEGKLDRLISLPVPRPTSCMFGGPNLDILFVTSATNGLSSERLNQFPLSGSVLAVHGVGQGMLVPPFS